MSYLLETLGRGLLGRLLDAFESQLPSSPEDADTLALRQRHATTSFDLALRLATAYLREARLSKARDAFEQARHLDGPAHLPALGLACVYAELDRLDRALHCLSRAHADDPGDPAITFAIGLCLEQQGDCDAAIQSYTRSVDLCPQLRNAYERLAAIAVHRGDWYEAHRCYAQLAQLEPDDLDVLLTLANLHLQQGDTADAVEVYQRALLIEPESATETLDDAELEDDGQLRQAIVALEKLVGKYPGATEFRVHLADLYVKAGDDHRAVAQYRAALDLQPSFLEATVKLGTQHLRRQRYEDAAQTFNRAVELNDRLLTAFVGLGVAQHVAGSERDAQATFDLAASLAPNSTLLFSETNRLHLKSLRRPGDTAFACDQPLPGPGQDEYLVEAIRRHQQVVLTCPHQADLHYRHGLLLRQIGDFAAAQQAFREALAINPSYVKALVKLGITCRELGQPEEALDIFRQVVSLDEQQVNLHYELALLFAQYNRFDLAVERFEASLTGKAGGREFRHNLALALQNIGMVDRADATWRSICELSRPTESALRHNRLHTDRDARRE
jgi:superkiller protein 3